MDARTAMDTSEATAKEEDNSDVMEDPEFLQSVLKNLSGLTQSTKLFTTPWAPYNYRFQWVVKGARRKRKTECASQCWRESIINPDLWTKWFSLGASFTSE